MAKIIEPIFDRTEDDLTNRTAKAFMNVLDWLRIYNNESVLNELVSFLINFGIDFSDLDAPTMATIPTATQINALITNIENIRLACGLPAIEGLTELKNDWTSGTSGVTPSYTSVNDWERVIYLILNNIAKTVEYFVYCGVCTCGQSRFYQHRWRQYYWIQPAVAPARYPRTNVAECGTGMTRQNLFRRY